MKPKLSGANVASFLLGFSSFLSTKSLGQIVYLEVAAVLFLSIKFIRRAIEGRDATETHLSKDVKFLLFFGFIWFLDQGFSNAYHQVSKLDQLLSLSQIFVLLVLMYWSLTWFQQNIKRIFYFIMGYCLSVLPTYFFIPTLYSRSYAWQFLFGPMITILVFLKLSRGHYSSPIKLTIISVLAALNLVGGGRSMALMTLLSATALLKRGVSKRRASSTLLILLAIVGTLFFAENIYKDLALSGKIGQNQQIKAQLQYSSGPLLLVGRSELLYALASLKENWIAGSGAKPEITTDILNRTAEFEISSGVIHTSTAAYQIYTKTGLLPMHSMLFSSWINGGIIALVFWMLLSWKILRWSYLSDISKGPLGLLSYYLVITYFWALLFSPLGAGPRVSLAFSIGVIYHQFKATQALESKDD